MPTEIRSTESGGDSCEITVPAADETITIANAAYVRLPLLILVRILNFELERANDDTLSPMTPSSHYSMIVNVEQHAMTDANRTPDVYLSRFTAKLISILQERLASTYPGCISTNEHVLI